MEQRFSIYAGLVYTLLYTNFEPTIIWLREIRQKGKSSFGCMSPNVKMNNNKCFIYLNYVSSNYGHLSNLNNFFILHEYKILFIFDTG